MGLSDEGLKGQDPCPSTGGVAGQGDFWDEVASNRDKRQCFMEHHRFISSSMCLDLVFPTGP